MQITTRMNVVRINSYPQQLRSRLSGVDQCRRIRLKVPIAAIALLSACDATIAPAPQEQLQLTTVAAATSELSLAAPLRLRTATAIDQNAVRAVALVNGSETVLQRDSSGRFVGQISVPAQSNVSVSVEFYEEFAGQQLSLASTQKTISTTTENATLNIMRGDFDYDAFDADSDGASNIVERENNTNPLDATESPTLARVDVYVERPTSAVGAGNNNYLIEATVGSVTNSASANGGDFQMEYTVAREDSINVDVRLIEQVTGQNVIIGTQTATISAANSYQAIRFNANNYNFNFDQDSDGASNLDELISGTEILAGPVAGVVPYTVTFAVPDVIANPLDTYATLLVQDQNFDLNYNDELYTADAFSPQGQPVVVDARILDTYAGQVVTLATFEAVVTPTLNQNLLLTNFNTNIDDDGDGQANYLELAQGTDPFNPPSAECTPITEELVLNISDDAFVQNGEVSNSSRLQVEYNERTSLIRYQFDPSRGSVTEANLSLTVSADQGDGEVEIYSVPNFEWSEGDSFLAVPNGTFAGALGGSFDRNNEYTFVLSPSAVTQDFTLIIAQESESDDIGFDASGTNSPPVLTVVVERCE